MWDAAWKSWINFHFKVLRQSLNCLLVKVVVVNLNFQLIWILTCKLYISWCNANIKRRPNPKGNMALLKTKFPDPTKTQQVINKFSSKRVQDHAVSLAVSSLSILGYFRGLCSVLSTFMLTLGARQNSTFPTLRGRRYQVIFCNMAVQKSLRWTQMVNLTDFGHLGPFWAHLDPFIPFQTKKDFLPR